MKTLNCLMLCLTTLTLTPAIAQQTAPGATTFAQRVQAANAKAAEAPEPPKLTRFDLDFPGGTPKQLVVAIEKATKRPLNAVIPDEAANEPIPPLKMSEVTVAELFKAIQMASMKNVPYPTSSYYGGGGMKPSFSYQQLQTSIGFQTEMPPTDNSIWYFHGREKVPDIARWSADPPPPKTCRFYPLSSYLDRGLTVDDITTAIQTGWKMLGDKETPSINYHKDTKLLIAVGEPNKLETIDAVLKALSPWSNPMPIPPGSPVPAPRPIEKPKTEN